MKHATSRMLFAYWDGLRGERAVPERRDVQPGGMRHVLADTFILALDAPQPPTFRLAGSRVCSLFCGDLGGRPFASIWGPEGQGEAARLVRCVVQNTTGLVAGLAGTNENGSTVLLELILLPLKHRARMQARVLGALSPAAVPSWAGLVPLRRVETRSVRVILPGHLEDDGFGEHAPPSLERRHLFVVHEGGQA